VTIGSASVLDGTAGGLIAAAANHVIAVSTATTSIYTKPYLVSGSTLTAGTGTTTTSGTQTLQKLAALGTRWYVGYVDAGVTGMGGVVSLNATGNGTTTISTASLGSATTTADAIIVGSNKVLVLNTQGSNNANLLTDTAGTASAGTAITLSSGTTRAALYVNSTSVMVGNASGIMTYVDCSGASAVLSKTWAFAGTFTTASNAVLTRTAAGIFGTAFVSNYGTITVPPIGASKDTPFVRWQSNFPLAANVTYRGKADSERWLADAATTIFKMECAA
jgi:hypothetical protein